MALVSRADSGILPDRERWLSILLQGKVAEPLPSLPFKPLFICPHRSIMYSRIFILRLKESQLAGRSKWHRSYPGVLCLWYLDTCTLLQEADRWLKVSSRLDSCGGYLIIVVVLKNRETSAIFAIKPLRRGFAAQCRSAFLCSIS